MNMKKLGIVIPTENEREKSLNSANILIQQLGVLVESLQEEMLLLEEKRSALITQVVQKASRQMFR